MTTSAGSVNKYFALTCAILLSLMSVDPLIAPFAGATLDAKGDAPSTSLPLTKILLYSPVFLSRSHADFPSPSYKYYI